MCDVMYKLHPHQCKRSHLTTVSTLHKSLRALMRVDVLKFIYILEGDKVESSS